MLIMYFIFILLLAIACRAHGAAVVDNTGKSTGWPKYGRNGCKVLFFTVFAAANYQLLQNLYLAIALGTLSVAALSTGHGRFYGMAGATEGDNSPEWIEKYIMSWAYKGDIHKPLYSYICMGIKGLGIGLAIAPYGLALAITWPIAYKLALKYFDDTAYAEYATGATAALAIIYAITN